MTFDLSRVVLCQMNPIMGDVAGNARVVKEWACQQDADALCVFPELCLVGYPAEDLAYSPALRTAIEHEIPKLAKALKDKASIIIGAPVWDGAEVRPYNAALLIYGGAVQATILKCDLPNYGVFDDKRSFRGGPLPAPVTFKGARLGILVCEDLWTPTAAAALKEQGADNLIAINASPYHRDKQATRRMPMARDRVRETGLPLVYVNQVGGQDDLVFDGQSFVMNPQGDIACLLPAFEEIVASSSMPAAALSPEEEIYKALVMATRDYVHKNNMKGAIIGLSGGIDSALVAAIAADALGPKHVRLVTLPSRFNSNESIDDAHMVAEQLGIVMEMQPIESVVNLFEQQLGITKGLAHENIQARVRGVTLMALSNAASGMLVLSTTNKSELAVGYGTMYGDMAGAFAPIKDLYKRDVVALAKWRGLPERVITKAPSAELRDNQKDADSLPPYDVLDALLYQLIEEDKAPSDVTGADSFTVERVARLLRSSEFKRRQGAPGPKISLKAFGRDRRYPMTNNLI